MTNTVPPPTSTALTAWHRITAAIGTGAPVPHGVSISDAVVSIDYLARRSDPATARDSAAAMARVLGLSDGPISSDDGQVLRWQSSHEDWLATGASWDVWAHLTGGGAS